MRQSQQKAKNHPMMLPSSWMPQRGTGLAGWHCRQTALDCSRWTIAIGSLIAIISNVKRRYLTLNVDIRNGSASVAAVGTNLVEVPTQQLTVLMLIGYPRNFALGRAYPFGR